MPKSPLKYQKNMRLYIAVVRKPDRPWLRKTGNTYQLIPGENHWETRGYYIFCDGVKINETAAGPSSTYNLTKHGTYTAVSVEWSGLESEPSKELVISRPAKLSILKEKPNDFSWTNQRWIVGRREVIEKEALKANKAVKETVHLYDSVIATAEYKSGKISAEFDLNADGDAIRRKFYKDGVLEKREYYSSEDELKVREIFDRDEYIIEQMVHFEDGKPQQHWFYEKGVPVKLITKEGNGRNAKQGPGTYMKKELDWVKVK
jgi:antitoxin component YwqK of YwqJK toxin-antitoxin module